MDDEKAEARAEPVVGELRVTVAVATVLRVFTDDIAEPRYGYELMGLTSFASGKLYPILARLEAAGWIEGSFEDIDKAAEGRPPRKQYTLTPGGVRAARQALAELHQQLAPKTPFVGWPKPAGGRG
ncbi:PadR family transcriptional regulator [Cryptosporangium phraense]|uniref:Helix-turn-helix transcriptional regulator n=1 Tax=Cryptosporangium phraense TaxID=2593070 RepID=A0A545ASU3_9ACTN|nr:PadR family transcriptional regulator [Cryptosporangium phraense]TQS44321.1 helix-turn-helix transcriptional regulator [Cryptosporangium phraense]